MYLPMALSTSDSPHSVGQAALIPVFTYRILQSYTDVNEDILAHFAKNNAAFYPPLSDRGGSLSDYVQSIFRANGRLVVCQANHRIVAATGISLNHPDWEYYFQYMSVDEDYRRQGLQQKMLAIAIRLFREAGATKIVTRTWSTNHASQGFFRKHGFIQSNTIFNDRGNGVHTYVFIKILAPLTS